MAYSIKSKPFNFINIFINYFTISINSTFSSTLLFLVLPLTDVFTSTGSDSPKPCAVTLNGSTPFVIKYKFILYSN